jgi:hypothetical protein
MSKTMSIGSQQGFDVNEVTTHLPTRPGSTGLALFAGECANNASGPVRQTTTTGCRSETLP